ncbi:MAG TPA: hypothetical protein VE152_14595 [Acidimicrobiales bacterium]|nr:hypothetical protein [Acidimicrobiales bacterium]
MAAPAAYHALATPPCNAQDARQVEVEHPLPALLAHLQDRRMEQWAAGGVDQHVDRAKLGPRPVDAGRNLVGAGDVAGDRDGRPTCCADGGDRLIEAGPGTHRYGGARLSEGDGESGADAPRRARHQGGAAVQRELFQAHGPVTAPT